MYAALSEPETDADDELKDTRVFARIAHELGGLAEAAQPGDPEIRGELATDLIAQTQSELQLREASPDVPFQIVLAIGVHLELRLQDQSLREEQLVLRAK